MTKQLCLVFLRHGVCLKKTIKKSTDSCAILALNVPQFVYKQHSFYL